MYERLCPVGHPVSDPTALRCPQRGCGLWIESESPSATAALEPSERLRLTDSPGLNLIAGSFVPALLAALLIVWAAHDGLAPESLSETLALFLIMTLVFVSNTMFFIGCIAEGVRLGTRR